MILAGTSAAVMLSGWYITRKFYFRVPLLLGEITAATINATLTNLATTNRESHLIALLVETDYTLARALLWSSGASCFMDSQTD